MTDSDFLPEIAIAPNTTADADVVSVSAALDGAPAENRSGAAGENRLHCAATHAQVMPPGPGSSTWQALSAGCEARAPRAPILIEGYSARGPGSWSELRAFMRCLRTVGIA